MIPLGIDESLRKIFAPILVGAIYKDSPNIQLKRKYYRECLPRFLAGFPSNIFKNEYAFFYEVINTLKIKAFTKGQLETIVEQNSDLILDSPYIDLSQWDNTIDNRPATEDEKVAAFSMNLMDIFEELSNELVDIVEFESAVNMYTDYYRDNTMLETAQNMSLIMTDLGYLEKQPKRRNVKYKGAEDAQKYYNNRVKLIRELSDGDRIQSTVIGDEWLEKELAAEEVEDTDTILDMGIQEIDDVIGGFRRTHMIGLLGPPKGGKTRLANYIVNRALNKGLNVLVWPLEGSKSEWMSVQTAAFIRTNSGQRIDSKAVLNRKYRDNDMRQLILAAKTRIATDYSRGRLSFLSGTAYVEDFIDVLQDHYDNENPFDVLVIDQLIHILSRDRMGKVERIGEGYTLLKDFITNKMSRGALAILPCQLKQSTIDRLRSNPDDTIDVTGGGESAETIRSPDEVLGLFSSKDERNAGKMKLYHVASRHSKSFDDFYARCEFECAHLYSDPDLNI